MKNVQKVLYTLVGLLGLYMIFQFGKGAINPPMVSGIAFVLLGLAGLAK